MRIEDVAPGARLVIAEVEKAIVGKREVLELVMAACLCPGGHVLIEDYPGLAKTLLARSFAAALGMRFRRIQFTPDLLPGDITGGYVYDRNENRFVLRRGPVFANVILADEINRASPKTQSALLEAMQEYQVTIEGETLPLEEPFIVIATQNPVEYEGTFPLPEAQLDRFIMKVAVGYPSAAEEKQILARRRERRTEDVGIDAVTDAAGVRAMRAAVEEVYVEPDLEGYMVELVSRTLDAVSGSLKRFSSFREYYDAETGQPIGERNHLRGLAPLGLFLKLVGIQKLTAKEIIISDFNPFPGQVTVKYQGTTIACHATFTMITFGNGQTARVSGPGPHRVSLE